jgi:hypothetical protein
VEATCLPHTPSRAIEISPERERKEKERKQSKQSKQKEEQ